MQKIKLLLTVILFLMTSSVFAHADLKTSVPKDGAMLMSSPKVLQLEFTKQVRLVKLTLENQSGAVIAIAFKPSTKASDTFSLALPMLPSSNYQVKWTAMGSDAHKMKGKFSFMVHGTNSMAKPKVMKNHKDSSSSDQHSH